MPGTSDACVRSLRTACGRTAHGLHSPPAMHQVGGAKHARVAPPLPPPAGDTRPDPSALAAVDSLALCLPPPSVRAIAHRETPRPGPARPDEFRLALAERSLPPYTIDHAAELARSRQCCCGGRCRRRPAPPPAAARHRPPLPASGARAPSRTAPGPGPCAAACPAQVSGLGTVHRRAERIVPRLPGHEGAPSRHPPRSLASHRPLDCTPSEPPFTRPLPTSPPPPLPRRGAGAALPAGHGAGGGLL